MADSFSAYAEGLDSPASNAAAVTTSDTTDLDNTTRYLYVGGAGNLSLIFKGGQTVTLNSVPAGTMLHVRVTRVRATGTTATNIVALW